MVKLRSIYIANFKKPILEEPLTFPEGVTLICGPNESGKSTILDAILYALYSRVIRPSAKPRNEDLVTYGRNRAVVRLDFSIGKRTFRVERRLHLKRPNTAFLWENLPNDQLRTLATGQREVTNEIEKLLGGISFHEIVASNIVAQKDLEHLIEQGKEDRKKVINAFLNLESFNTVLQDLNENRRTLGGTPARPGKLTLQQQKLDSLQEKLEEFNRKKTEREETEQQIRQLKKKITQIEKDLRKTSKLYNVLETYSKAHDEKQQISTKIDGKKNLVEELEKQIEQLRKVEKNLEETEKKLKGYIDLEEVNGTLNKIKDRVKTLSGIHIQHQEKEKQQSKVAASVSDLEQRLAGVDRTKVTQIAQRGALTWPFIGGAAACLILAFILFAMNMPIVLCGLLAIVGVILLVFVGRQISVESKLRAALSDVQRLQDLQRELVDMSKQVEAMSSQMSEIEQGILGGCKGIGRYSSIFQERSSEGPVVVAEAMFEALDQDNQEKNRLEERKRNLGAQLEEKPKVLESQQTAKEELDRLQKAFETVKFPTLPKGIVFSEELLRETSDTKETLGKDLIEKETRLKNSQEDVEELTEYVKENKDLPTQTEKQAELVESLKREFEVIRLSIEGVEKTAEALRSRVKPGVEQYMGLILPMITNGRYKAVQLDHGYNFEVWDPDAGEFKVKEVFSGGTEDQFLLSMRLAFALALLPEVKGMHPEFLFLDEPLASSDEERREGIIQLLNTELSARFKQIFLISHVTNLQTEVQNMIRLENGRVVEQHQ